MYIYIRLDYINFGFRFFGALPSSTLVTQLGAAMHGLSTSALNNTIYFHLCLTTFGTCSPIIYTLRVLWQWIKSIYFEFRP